MLPLLTVCRNVLNITEREVIDKQQEPYTPQLSDK